MDKLYDTFSNYKIYFPRNVGFWLYPGRIRTFLKHVGMVRRSGKNKQERTHFSHLRTSAPGGKKRDDLSSKQVWYVIIITQRLAFYLSDEDCVCGFDRNTVIIGYDHKHIYRQPCPFLLSTYYFSEKIDGARYGLLYMAQGQEVEHCLPKYALLGSMKCKMLWCTNTHTRGKWSAWSWRAKTLCPEHKYLHLSFYPHYQSLFVVNWTTEMSSYLILLQDTHILLQPFFMLYPNDTSNAEFWSHHFPHSKSLTSPQN